jgi:hypothetical protein
MSSDAVRRNVCAAMFAIVATFPSPCEGCVLQCLAVLKSQRLFGAPQVSFARAAAVCTENLIHVDEVAESPKLAQ